MGSTLPGFTCHEIQSEAWLQSAFMWWGQTVSGHSETHTAPLILFGSFYMWQAGWGFTLGTPADSERVTVTFRWSMFVQQWAVWAISGLDHPGNSGKHTFIWFCPSLTKVDVVPARIRIIWPYIDKPSPPHWIHICLMRYFRHFSTRAGGLTKGTNPEPFSTDQMALERILPHALLNGRMSAGICDITANVNLSPKLCPNVTDWEWDWGGPPPLTHAGMVAAAGAAAPWWPVRVGKLATGKWLPRETQELAKFGMKEFKVRSIWVTGNQTWLFSAQLCSLLNILLRTQGNFSQRKTLLVEKYWVWADRGGCEGQPLFCVK